MKHTSRSTLAIVSLATVFSLFPLIQTASAASLCNGLDIKACGAQADCKWVNSYKTKKGKTINAYCRKQPAKKQGADAGKTGQLKQTDKPG